MTVMGKYFKVPDLQGSVSIFLTLSEKKGYVDSHLMGAWPVVAPELLALFWKSVLLEQIQQSSWMAEANSYSWDLGIDWSLLFNLNAALRGFPWWSSGEEFTLPKQGAQFRCLVGELDPVCYNEDSAQPNK